ncbi:MAG: hypothetical protein U1E59_12370 [Amaricoccus sp.]
MARRSKPSNPSTIAGQFIAHRVAMLESDAWACLTFTARRALDRLEIEHAHHGGKENGNLVCTYRDFEHFGIRRPSIPSAIRLLVAAGLLEITHQGRGGNSDFRDPSRYRLTYLPTLKHKPTDEWERFTLPAPLPVRDIESRHENVTGPVGTKTCPKKPSAGYGNVPEAGYENVPGVANLGRLRA